MNMTLGVFEIMVEEMSIILNLENGGKTEEKPLSGETGFRALKTMLPGHRSKK